MADPQVAVAERTRVSAEQVQRADDLLAQPHRHGLHGAEPGPGGGGGEPGPYLARASEGADGDGLPGAEAIQARSLLVLDLEQLDQPGFLTGGCRSPRDEPPRPAFMCFRRQPQQQDGSPRTASADRGVSGLG
jgi:hypothetical protein